MNTIHIRIYTLTFILFLLVGCTSQSDDNAVISGEVTEFSSGNSIESATIQVTSPQEYNDIFTRSDADGRYSLGGIDIPELIDIEITASATDYLDQTKTLKVASGDEINNFNFELAQEGQGDGGGDDDGDDDGDEEVVGEAGGPAQIQLVSVPSPAINVAETGGITSTTFTFEVQDSAGRTVERDHEVLFEIIRGPEGGEYLTPESVLTNSDGRVTSNLVSGDSSGTVRIQATIERSDIGITIRSTPVIISISSGFPHPENFNVAPRVYNFDAYGYIDEDYTNNITASVGDLKGNPVKEGTAVYFSSKYGGLVNGSAITNQNGYASVNLSANGSTPQNHPDGVGFIDITAQTVDKDNNYIEEKMTMLLTTRRAIITVEPDAFDISNSGSQNFDVTIRDVNGYPMATNTQISISTGPGLVASGDVTGLKLGNYFSPGPGTTEFSFSISDADPDEIVDTDGSFTITVETPSGAVSTKTVFGQRAKSRNN